MLIKLKRDFFSADGVLYRKGLVEYNGDPKQIPSDAEVMSKDGHLPVQENTPKAGHGAKPLEEQVLDLIPGAGKTHQLDLTSAPADKADAKDQEKALAEQKAEVEAGLKNAEKAAEKVEQVTDPLAGLKKK